MKTIKQVLQIGALGLIALTAMSCNDKCGSKKCDTEEKCCPSEEEKCDTEEKCCPSEEKKCDTAEKCCPSKKNGSVQPDAAAQSKLTADSVLADLMAGNKRFTEATLTKKNLEARMKQGTKGQHPKAYVLSCVDSRVPVELLFDQSIGDIFVGRVAGNVEGVDQLGSMEYAAAVAGVKLVVVLGHEACGAVKGACDHVKLGNITALLAEIEPAVASVKGHEGKRTSKNKKFVAEAVEANVKATVADIRKRSEVLYNLEKSGKIKIVGGVYSLHTGAVTLFN